MKIPRRDAYRIAAVVLFALTGYVLKVPENIVMFTGLVFIIGWYFRDVSEQNPPNP